MFQIITFYTYWNWSKFWLNIYIRQIIIIYVFNHNYIFAAKVRYFYLFIYLSYGIILGYYLINLYALWFYIGSYVYYVRLKQNNLIYIDTVYKRYILSKFFYNLTTIYLYRFYSAIRLNITIKVLRYVSKVRQRVIHLCFKTVSNKKISRLGVRCLKFYSYLSQINLFFSSYSWPAIDIFNYHSRFINYKYFSFLNIYLNNTIFLNNLIYWYIYLPFNIYLLSLQLNSFVSLMQNNFYMFFQSIWQKIYNYIDFCYNIEFDFWTLSVYQIKWINIYLEYFLFYFIYYQWSYIYFYNWKYLY